MEVRNKKRIFVYLTPAIIIILVGLWYYFTYINDKEYISIPLKVKTAYIYKGKYITGGSQKKIEMEAPEHRIVVEREFNVSGEKRYLVSSWIGPVRAYALILYEGEDAIYVVMGKDKKIPVIPRHIHRGKKWEFDIGSRHFKGWAGKKVKGKYNARKIYLKSDAGTFVELGIDSNVGIVSIDYKYRGGANFEEAKLFLKEVKNLSNN